MKRVSVTELDVWQECHLRWRYRFGDGWRKEGASGPQGSGLAVHSGIEMGLLSGEGDKQKIAEEAALLYLEANVKEAEKYKGGVLKALAGVPDWVWQLRLPQTEFKLEVLYPEVGLVMVGKPDLWFMAIGGEGKGPGSTHWYRGVCIVDFKTTSKDEEAKLKQYETWSPQIRRYGVLLRRALGREVPVYGRFIVLSTRGKHAIGEEFYLPPSVLDRAEDEMLRIAGRVGEDEDATWGWGCEWCDYRDVDEVRLGGGDWEGVLREEFVQRGKDSNDRV